MLKLGNPLSPLPRTAVRATRRHRVRREEGVKPWLLGQPIALCLCTRDGSLQAQFTQLLEHQFQHGLVMLPHDTQSSEFVYRGCPGDLVIEGPQILHNPLPPQPVEVNKVCMPLFANQHVWQAKITVNEFPFMESGHGLADCHLNDIDVRGV